MADLDSSFAQRILRRASLRRNRDSIGTLNATREVLQRREKILRAINDSSYRRGSCIGINDSSYQLDQSIGHDVSMCTTISCANNNNMNNNNDDSITDAYNKIDINPKKSVSKDINIWELRSLSNSEQPNNRLLSKLKDFNQPKKPLLRTSSKIQDDSVKKVSKVPNKKEENIETLPKVISEPNSTLTMDSDATFDNLNFTQITESFVTPLLRTFNDSDTDSESLRVTNFTTEAVIEMCKNVYTSLDIDCSDSEDSNIIIPKTPKNTPKKFVTSSETPTLESPKKLDDCHLDPRKRLFSNSSSLIPAAVDWNSVCSEKWDESSLSISAPYDEDKFLSNALGEELYKMSITYDDSYTRDRTRSDFTASDLMTDDDYQVVQKKHNRQVENNNPTSEITSPSSSSALNTSIKIYRSLSQRIKSKFRPKLKLKKEQPVAVVKPSSSEEIDRIQDLLHEVKAQQIIMNDAANALRLLDAQKVHLNNLEKVKFERNLLLSSLRRKAALDEIKNITSEDGNKKKPSFREEAEITVSGMSLDIRFEQILNNETEWFVVAVTQGLNVWVTRANPYIGNNMRLRFTESIAIPHLNPGFKIVVQIYSLRLKSIKTSEEKSRTNKESKSTSCLQYSDILVSPTKLFKKNDSPVLEDKNNAWKSRNSAFVLSGFTELFLPDLSSTSSWPLMLVPKNSRLKGNIDLNLACRLHLATSHEGFLNFYEEISGLAAWNRRWCVLKGHTLMFWNYPREQDIKEPLKMIELMRCVSNEITTVDRTICPKLRTLLIETKRCRRPGDRNSIIVECTSTSTFVRNLLSFDTADELNEWSEKLNHVLLALEEWQIIGQRTQPQVSDL